MRQALTLLFILISFISFAQDKVEYWPNGKVRYEKKCKADSCEWRYYYENGQLEKLGIDTTLYGLTTYLEEYCENGQLKIKYNPNAWEPQKITKYFCNGKIEQEYWYCKFGYRGEFKVYHMNGQVAEQGKFEKGKHLYSDQRVGLWESFTPEGVKFYEAFYENGEKVWHKKY